MAGSLELPDDGRCAFCDYLAGRRPYSVLWREPQVAVLVTREQRGVSHLLVLPVRHQETLLDLRDDEASDLLLALRDAAAAIQGAHRSPGIAVWQNNGRPAHQVISHLHFHVAGTLDGGGTEFGEVPELAVEQTDDIARQLGAHIPASPRVMRVVPGRPPTPP